MEKPAIVLVHGLCFFDIGPKMKVIGRFLKKEGWDTHLIDLEPNDGSGDLKYLAQQLADFIEEINAPTINLIAFSMGGLICQYYLQTLPKTKKVEQLITISTPHYGTLAGFLSRKTGIKQMRPNSSFLKELNNNVSALSSVKVTSIWTPLDLTILPANSSVISFGENKKIICLAHPLMISNKECLKIIKNTL